MKMKMKMITAKQRSSIDKKEEGEEEAQDDTLKGPTKRRTISGREKGKK